MRREQRLGQRPQHVAEQQQCRAREHAAQRPARGVAQRGAGAAREQRDDARIDHREHRIGGGEHGAHDAVGHEIQAELGLCHLHRCGGRQRERIGGAGDRHRHHRPAEPQAGGELVRSPQLRSAGVRLGQVAPQPPPAEQRQRRRRAQLEGDVGEHAVGERPAQQQHRAVDHELDPRPSVELLRRLQVPGGGPAERAGERGDGEGVLPAMRGTAGPLHRRDRQQHRGHAQQAARREHLPGEAPASRRIGRHRDARGGSEKAAFDDHRQQTGPHEDEAEATELFRSDPRRDHRQHDERQQEPQRGRGVHRRQRLRQPRRRNARRHVLTTRRAV